MVETGEPVVPAQAIWRAITRLSSKAHCPFLKLSCGDVLGLKYGGGVGVSLGHSVYLRVHEQRMQTALSNISQAGHQTKHLPDTFSELGGFKNRF